MLLHNAPNQLVIDSGVSMNQHIAQANGLRQVCNGGRSRGIDFAELTQRFTDDLHLTLDSRAKQLVLQVVREGLALHKAPGALGSLQGIPQVFG